MPRHPSLVPLSHDHHHSLVLALRLKKGGPASKHDLWPEEELAHAKETLRFAEAEILPHFRIEEEILFGNIEDIEIRNIEHSLITEHATIRQMLKKLLALTESRDDTALGKLLSDLGRTLEAHIRREEREYFPMLESKVDSEMLVRLGSEIAAAHNPESPFRVCKI